MRERESRERTDPRNKFWSAWTLKVSVKEGCLGVSVGSAKSGSQGHGIETHVRLHAQ